MAPETSSICRSLRASWQTKGHQISPFKHNNLDHSPKPSNLSWPSGDTANFEKGTINTVSPLPHNDIALTKLVLRSTRKFSVLILHASWQQSRLTLLIRASLKLPRVFPLLLDAPLRSLF
ncbi:hypothetical protein CapIbe_023390 [Capra ibex]